MRKHKNKIPPSPLERELTKAAALPQLSHAGECRNPDCSMCPAWREKLGRANQTEIYSVKGRVRYCRCRICGHTWKFSLSEATSS